jgi:uncharacterized membrane protein YkoI
MLGRFRLTPGTDAPIGKSMSKRFITLLLAILSLAALSTAPDAAEAGAYPHWLARRGGDSDGGTSLSEAVQQVQRETGGRVLSADTVSQGGRSVHRIKVLLPSGHVRVVTVDAGR